MRTAAFGSLLLVLAALCCYTAAHAATLKSVQSGSIALSPAGQNVTITSVDLTKAIVIGYSRTNSSAATNRATFELTSSTNVAITASAANASNIAQWYVVEFNSVTSRKLYVR